MRFTMFARISRKRPRLSPRKIEKQTTARFFCGPRCELAWTASKWGLSQAQATCLQPSKTTLDVATQHVTNQGSATPST